MTCKYCDKPFPADAKSNRRFCNKVCAGAFAKELWRQQNPKSALGTIATGTKAEINEMRVAIDLLEKGYEVYRAAFQGMPCDLLVRMGRETYGADAEPLFLTTILRVEVTTGNKSPNGTVAHPKRDAAAYDMLAVVVGSEIIYK